MYTGSQKPAGSSCHVQHLRIRSVGQNHIYTVYIRHFRQGNHQVYGHIRCIYMVLSVEVYIGGLTHIGKPTRLLANGV